MRRLQESLDRFNEGEQSGRADLIEHAQAVLLRLAHRMLKGYPGLREYGVDSEEIRQEASVRLMCALQNVRPHTVEAFLFFAAAEIRTVLIDEARHRIGRHAPGKRAHSRQPADSPPVEPADIEQDPVEFARWTEFHEAVARLPEDEQQVFSLHFYFQLTHEQSAVLLSISLKTVKRRWKSASTLVKAALDGKSPMA